MSGLGLAALCVICMICVGSAMWAGRCAQRAEAALEDLRALRSE